jgi:hypothetical protein
MKTRKELVLGRLQRAVRECGGDPERAWVCARSLMHPTVGGNRWNARLHELIDDGVRVEKRTVCECGDCRYFRRKAEARGERPSHMTAWRLIDLADAERAA